MILPVHCAQCGLTFQSAFTSGITATSGTVTLRGNIESCPRCGAACATPDGVFDLAEEARRAFRQPGVTREQLEAFKFAAEAARDGGIAAEAAQAELSQVSQTFARLLSFTNGNATVISILIGIISLFLLLYQIHDADLSTQQLHQDNVYQLQATQTLVQATQSAAQASLTVAKVQTKIDAELAKLSAAAQQQAARPSPTQKLLAIHPPQTQASVAPLNRHDRRAAASRARKRQPRS